MCGRYAIFGPVSTSRATRAALDDLHVDLESLLNQREPQYNLAPTHKAPVLTYGEDGVHLGATRWGLVPSWAKDEKIGSKLINARVETVADKPSFRAAFKRRRCLVPASGYFEWKGEAGTKQPYFIHDADGYLLMFGGLWEVWSTGADGDRLHTFTIITGAPGKVSGDIHDRQPVILPPNSWADWLNEAPDVAQDILTHVSPAALSYYPVSKTVGSPRNKGPEIVEPIKL